MLGLDTVESLSVEVKGSKVANFTVLVANSLTLASTLSSTLASIKVELFCNNLVKIFLVL